MSNYKLIRHRKIIPRVIKNRIAVARWIVRNFKTLRSIERQLEELFEDTKVQVGDFYEPRHNERGLFIRNGFKNKAHYLIIKK